MPYQIAIKICGGEAYLESPLHRLLFRAAGKSFLGLLEIIWIALGLLEYHSWGRMDVTWVVSGLLEHRVWRHWTSSRLKAARMPLLGSLEIV